MNPSPTSVTSFRHVVTTGSYGYFGVIAEALKTIVEMQYIKRGFNNFAISNPMGRSCARLFGLHWIANIIA